MITLQKPMHRRAWLKGILGGVAATVALPPLEAMMNLHGNAWANGDPLPTRFGVWFWGNGIRREHWIPDGTGFDWRPRAETASLEQHRQHVSFITGCEIKTHRHPHHSGMTGIMTGMPLHQNGTTRDTIVSSFAGPSVDQIAAAHYQGQTPFRSLEVAVCKFWGTDEGTTFQHLSHNGPNNVNASEYNPRRVFDRLFGMGPSAPQLDLARRSVLDSVKGQITRLQGKVGARDRARLDQHFESIRAIELRLGAAQAACAVGEPPLPDYPDIEGREQIQEKNTAMSQLVALALACDLTRAFSVMFSTAGSGVIVWPTGAPNSLHQMCHDEPGAQPQVHAAVTYIMERLSDFLGHLKAIPEGDGNLLDHCSILCTTELSEGNVHSNDEYPIIIAGRGGGRLKGGYHHRAGGNPNTSHAVLTALRAGGVPAPTFGAGPGLVDASFGELEA